MDMNRDRLNPLSVVAKLSSTDGKEYETMLYTGRGVMEICRWSNKSKANQFMDWVWDIVEKYRNHELTNVTQINITPITEAITSISQAITTLTNNMAAMQQDIQVSFLHNEELFYITYKKRKDKKLWITL